MDFDPLDLVNSNLSLLNEAAQLKEPEPAVLITVATWGRGADPEFLKALQPYRHGLGFNGSIVARIPLDLGKEWLSDEALQKMEEARSRGETPVYSAVFKNWVVDTL